MEMPAFGQIMEPTYKTLEISSDVDRESTSPVDALYIITSTIHERVKYVPDIKVWDDIDMFQNPDTTLDLGTGDCEDYSFLIASVINGLRRNKPDSVRVSIGDLRVPLNPIITHAWVESRVGEKWYICEGTAGKVFEAPDLRYEPYIGLYKNKLKFIKTDWR